jgi:sulfite reductase beta subunit-like hemoprotein
MSMVKLSKINHRSQTPCLKIKNRINVQIKWIIIHNIPK